MYWITGALGFLLVIAPYMLGFTDNSAAFWTSGILGGLTLIVSAVEWVRRGTDRFEYWIAALAGLATVSAPFVLRFDHIATALWTSLTVGILLTIFASAKIFSDQTRYA